MTDVPTPRDDTVSDPAREREPGTDQTDPAASGGELVASDEHDIDDITGQVEQPAKVMRIGTMIKQLLEEVRAAPLDEAGRRRLREIHETSVRELSDGLAPELRDELDRLSIPFGDDTPSEAV
ncbi:proteasome activator, partial [Jatrophihabitans endophyticus]|uniref:proteasome activator n=1 Tax=Jatrophihabitans endophyticus TaxID=1206085 RepID=UPI0019E9E239